MGAEKAYQHDFYEKRYIGTDLPSHDFAAIAESFGIRGLRANSAQSLELAVKEAFANEGPTVIDVSIDPEILSASARTFFRKFQVSGAQRTAVVTGSGRGIGKATVEVLEAQGVRVIGVDLTGADVNADLSTPEGRAGTGGWRS